MNKNRETTQEWIKRISVDTSERVQQKGTRTGNIIQAHITNNKELLQMMKTLIKKYGNAEDRGRLELLLRKQKRRMDNAYGTSNIQG